MVTEDKQRAVQHFMQHIIDLLHALGIADPGGSGWVAVILTFLVAGLAVWRLMPRIRTYAKEVGWADEPNARRMNKEPLPNAGGLVIFSGVAVALVITALLRPIGIEDVQINVLAILLGGSFMIMAGFIDDQFGLPPLVRLLVQLVAALLLVSTGIRIEIGFGGDFATTLSVIFTVVWIMAITNAMNLIDGIDGLAGGVSLITAISLMAVSAQDHSKAAATIVLAAVAGAALGFLRHNLPPSRIIMGDSGAYFFGFVLAASSILGNLKITTAFSLFPTVLFLFLPLLDTVQVIVRRLVEAQEPHLQSGKRPPAPRSAGLGRLAGAHRHAVARGDAGGQYPCHGGPGPVGSGHRGDVSGDPDPSGLGSLAAEARLPPGDLRPGRRKNRGEARNLTFGLAVLAASEKTHGVQVFRTEGHHGTVR